MSVSLADHTDAIGDEITGAHWDAVAKFMAEAKRGLVGKADEVRTAEAGRLAARVIGAQGVTTLLIAASKKAQEAAANCKNCATNLGQATVGLDDYIKDVKSGAIDPDKVDDEDDMD